MDLNILTTNSQKPFVGMGQCLPDAAENVSIAQDLWRNIPHRLQEARQSRSGHIWAAYSWYHIEALIFHPKCLTLFVAVLAWSIFSFLHFLCSVQSIHRFRITLKCTLSLFMVMIVLCSLSAICTNSWEKQSLTYLKTISHTQQNNWQDNFFW